MEPSRSRWQDIIDLRETIQPQTAPAPEINYAKCIEGLELDTRRWGESY